MMRNSFVVSFVCFVFVGSLHADQPAELTESTTLGSVVGQIKDVLVVGVSKTRLVNETRTRKTAYIDASGEAREQAVMYVVQKPVSETQHIAFGMSSVAFTQPDGNHLPKELAKKRLVEGAPVVICHAPQLPVVWQKALSEKTIVILRTAPQTPLALGPRHTPWEPITVPTEGFPSSPIVEQGGTAIGGTVIEEGDPVNRQGRPPKY